MRLFWLSLLHFLTNFVKPKFYGLQKLRPFRGYPVFCCLMSRRGSCHAQIQNAHKKGVASFKKFDFRMVIKISGRAIVVVSTHDMMHERYPSGGLVPLLRNIVSE